MRAYGNKSTDYVKCTLVVAFISCGGVMMIAVGKDVGGSQQNLFEPDVIRVE